MKTSSVLLVIILFNWSVYASSSNRRREEQSVRSDQARQYTYGSNRYSHQSGGHRRSTGGGSQTHRSHNSARGGDSQFYESLIPVGGSQSVGARRNFVSGSGGRSSYMSGDGRGNSFVSGGGYGNSFVSGGGRPGNSFVSGDGFGNNFDSESGMRRLNLGGEGSGNLMQVGGNMGGGSGGCGLGEIGNMISGLLAGNGGGGGQNPLLSAIQCILGYLMSGGRGGGANLQTIMNMLGGAAGGNAGQIASMISSLIAGPSNSINSPELQKAAEDAKRALEAGESLETVQARLPPGFRIQRQDPGLPSNVRSQEMANAIETAKSVFSRGGNADEIQSYLPPGFTITGDINTYQIRGPGQFYTGQNADTNGPIQRMAANFVENGVRTGYAAAKFDVDEPGQTRGQDLSQGQDLSRGIDLSRGQSRQYSGQYSGPDVSASFNRRYNPSGSVNKNMSIRSGPSAGASSRGQPRGISGSGYSGGSNRDFSRTVDSGRHSRNVHTDRNLSHRTNDRRTRSTGGSEGMHSNRGAFESVGSASTNGAKHMVHHKSQNRSDRSHSNVRRGSSESVGSASMGHLPIPKSSRSNVRSSGEDVSVYSKSAKSAATPKPSIKKAVKFALSGSSRSKSSGNKENSVSGGIVPQYAKPPKSSKS